jgi:hypothetical protein
MEEFIELPSDGRIINKRYIFDFNPTRQNRLNYSNGNWVLLKDPRDAKAVTDALGASAPDAKQQQKRVVQRRQKRPKKVS